jgi:hypothetical protein
VREERTGRSVLDAPGTEAVLPADAITVGRSIRGEAILVAHTGQAHLGMTLDRRFARDLDRLQSTAPAGGTAPTLDDAGFDGRVDLPAVIPFRHVTAHELSVVDGDIYVTLHATGDPSKPDVHVEQRIDRALLQGVRLCTSEQGLRLAAPLVVAVLLLVAGIACLLLGARA